MNLVAKQFSLRDVQLAGVLAVVSIACALGVVQQPWLITGALCGIIVLVIAISAPIALLAAMLILGALDLSFMTGGAKGLFTNLGGLDMNGIRLVGATAGFSLFIMNAPAARAAILGRAGRFYMLFLIAAFLTLPTSFDPLEGLRLLLKLAYPFLTFLLVIGLCDTKEKLEMLTRYTLIAGAAIIFIINPVFALDGGYRIDPLGYKRIRGIGAHENPFSFYLMILLFISFARLIFRKQMRYLWLCVGAGVWITLTMTRITYLAAIVGILVISLMTAAAQRQYRALAAGVIVTLIIAVPGLPFILDRSLGFVPAPSELFSLISSPQALYESINWQGRTNLWPIVWSGFMAAPIFGLGLGSSGVVIAQHFPAEAAGVAHNEYLRLAADLGVVGLVLFGGAIMVWLISTVRAGLRRSNELAEYAIPAAASIVAWGVVALTDNPLDYYMFYTQYVGFLVGATVAMQSIMSKATHVDHRLS